MSEEQRSIILSALEEVLSSAAFRQSRRCSSLLRGLVERAVSGDSRSFKERTLGVEIFGRPADYDTNADPIVRMTATEIRKRLAQFYQQPGHPTAVVIHLVPGTYSPQFDFQVTHVPSVDGHNAAVSKPENQDENIAGIAPSVNGAQVVAATEVPEIRDGKTGHKAALPMATRRLLIVGACAILIAAVAGAVASLGIFRSSQYLVWRPLLQSGLPSMICLSDDGLLQDAQSLQVIADIIASRQAIADGSGPSSASSPFGDVNVAHKVSLFMAQHGAATTLRPTSKLTLWDFRKAPVILVGYLDNPWSLVLLSKLRYKVGVDSKTREIWIQDEQNPDKREWTEPQQTDGSAQYDYAIISRFVDPETSNWIMAIAGLGPMGTDAASQLLTDPAFDKLLPREVRSKKNFQIVIRANVISGKVSAPQVLAFHYW